MQVFFVFLVIVVSIAVFAVGIFLYQRSLRLKKDLEEKQKGMQRKMYELAILKELGDRIGYSLNIQNIVDIITGSLHQFIEYKVVSYMLLQPEKIIFKAHLEESVSHTFVQDIKDRMLKSLSALLGIEFKEQSVEEVVTGAVFVDEVEDPVKSFFNIPLVIGEKVVGVLTVAHTNSDLYGEEETTILYKITQQASQAVTRLQEVIMTEQKKLNAMVESMSEGVVMTDNDYRIMVVNPAAKEIIGLSNKEEITVFDFIDNLEGRFDIRGKLEESVKLNKNLVSEEVLIGEHYFKIFVSPVKTNVALSDSEIIGGVVIFHNITKEKEAEQMREDFTSMMVHELRSPLSGIKGISQLMKSDKKKKSKKDKEYADVLFDSSSRMLDLVNDLLDVAKISAGKFEIHQVPSELIPLIKQSVKLLTPVAKEGKVDLTIEMAHNVPKEIEFDAVRINQTLVNFLSNAIKFTNPGGNVVVQAFAHVKGHDIATETQELDTKWISNSDNESQEMLKNMPSSIVVAVTDNGHGIAQSDIPMLFNKFQQLKASMTNEKKGTGLGLSIVKGIIEAHGGQVGVVSMEGEGSTFYFTIPTFDDKIGTEISTVEE